jgi:HPt (histidine-containing phosphotransfer) domain-containing protein
VDALGRTLERWLPRTSEVWKGAKPLSQTAAAPPVDLELLSGAACGDRQMMKELAEIYLSQTAKDLERLREAVKSGDSRAVERIAHSCVGGSATCGMTAVVEPLRDLERMGEVGDLALAETACRRAEEGFRRIGTFLGDRRA